MYAPSNGLSQPGTIHSDSDGSGCGSNENIYTGQANNGIVAYAAPTSCGLADPTKPGRSLGVRSPTRPQRHDLARLRHQGVRLQRPLPGQARARVRRSAPAAGSTANPSTTATSPQSRRCATPRTPSFTAAPSWSTKINSCSPTQAAVDRLNLTASSQLYINCNANNGFNPSTALTINAGTIVFSGTVKPGNTLKLPNATTSTSSGTAATRSRWATAARSACTPDRRTRTWSAASARTPPTVVPNKAVLVVKNGAIKQTNGSTLQMCYTTVLMMGGQTDACLPSSPSTAAPNPTTPCGGSSGTGQFTQTGGNVDWTAPNRYDATMLSDGSADPTKQSEWADANGPEDLGLWSESGGTSSNPKYQMTGGGAVHLRGVLMAPNAQPFVLSGQFNQTLINAQYVVSSISLSSNNTSITMMVDPNAAVTLPKLMVVGLVR